MGLVASCLLHTARPRQGESRASRPSSSRQEQQWQHIVPSRGTEHDWARAVSRSSILRLPGIGR